MRILFVADGRSPIARSWISGVVEQGHEVHLATTYRCDPIGGTRSLTEVPVAFSGLKGDPSGAGHGVGVRGRARLRQWLGPLTVPFRAGRLEAVARRLRPDLVHALRVPFEGMLTAWVDLSAPLVISTWGNDFTLHAPSSPGMGWLTRRAMAAAAGLHADCRRDLRLAAKWGFPADRPSVVLPGNGGIDPSFFEPPAAPGNGISGIGQILPSLPEGRAVVVNPRGFRSYVRNDTFFKCIPAVLSKRPETAFVCPMMAGDRLAESWVKRLGVAESVWLVGRLGPAEMAALFRRAQVAVSPSEHDGTPNSLLEAMACGAVPVVGDLESLREWIEDGTNGYLVDPADPQALARAIVAALSNSSWRRRAADQNRELVRAWANRRPVMATANVFYQLVYEQAARRRPGGAML